MSGIWKEATHAAGLEEEAELRCKAKETHEYPISKAIRPQYSSNYKSKAKINTNPGSCRPKEQGLGPYYIYATFG